MTDEELAGTASSSLPTGFAPRNACKWLHSHSLKKNA
jgi:hypothetical protein